MFTDLIIVNTMKGTGGEFFLNLLVDKYERPESFVSANRYWHTDIIPEISFILDHWADAYANGYDKLDDYLFYDIFEEDVIAYDRFITRKALVQGLSYDTLKSYCDSRLQTIQQSNVGLKAFVSHYSRQETAPIIKYFPPAKVIKINTQNVNPYYYRLLFILKYYLSQQPSLTPKMAKFLLDDYMFFDRPNVFDHHYESEFNVDAERLFFKFDPKISKELSEYLDTDVNIDMARVRKYTELNNELLQIHLNYNAKVSDKDADAIFWEYRNKRVV